MSDAFTDLGFELTQRRKDGGNRYTRRAHPYLVYWLDTWPDGRAELTWELAVGEYLKAKGMTLSAQDELSLFAFPPAEVSGRADGTWVRDELDRTQRMLADVDFAAGT